MDRQAEEVSAQGLGVVGRAFIRTRCEGRRPPVRLSASMDLIRFAPPLALFGLLAGCMLDPGNGEVLASTQAAAPFSGHLTTPAGSVQLRASQSPTGPFAAWPGSSGTASTTPYFFSVPDGSGGSIPIYPWSIAAVIPASFWTTEAGADGCEVSATYVRGMTGPYNLYSFDAPSPTYPGGTACLAQEFIAGEGILTALQTCRSASSPVVRLEAPDEAVHVGNVVITSQAEADAFACVYTIDGNLTVAPASPVTIDLPRLRTVTGDVALSLPVEAPPGGPFSEARCGSSTPSSVQSVITRVHLPELSQIDGNLDIDAPSTGVGTTSGERIELDLDALVNLAGNLDISFGTPAVSPCGLSNLVNAGGDLSLAFSTGDVGGGSLLTSLEEVDGNVALSGGFTMIGVLGQLEHAGSLSVQDIANPIPSSTLDGLLTVDGSVYLHDLPGNPLVTNLTSAGALVLDDVGFFSLSAVGSASVDVGTLSLLSNPSLATLGSATSSNLNLTVGASLVIGTGSGANPALTTAEVCEFVGYQQTANGWVPQGSGFSCP